MIGFDIIDLSDPLLQQRTERALKLVMNESDRIDQQVPVASDFWKLWTAKEAAYKCLPIMDRYRPTTLLTSIIGHRFVVNDACHGSFHVDDDLLVATCALAGLPAPNFWYTFLSNSADRKIYEAVIMSFFKEKYGEVEVVRNLHQTPMVFVASMKCYIYLSISHHHHFFGFSWMEATASQCHLPS